MIHNLILGNMGYKTGSLRTHKRPRASQQGWHHRSMPSQIAERLNRPICPRAASRRKALEFNAEAVQAFEEGDEGMVGGSVLAEPAAEVVE